MRQVRRYSDLNHSLWQTLSHFYQTFNHQIAIISRLQYSVNKEGVCQMTKPCDKPLKQNPFLTYRDPETGKWIVTKSAPVQATTLAA